MSRDNLIGVYSISTPRGECYVGMTTRGFKLRWSEHRSKLRRGAHHCSPLQRAYNEDAVSLTFTILEAWDGSEFRTPREMGTRISESELRWWREIRGAGASMLNDEPTATGSVRHGEATKEAISSTIREKSGCHCPTKLHLLGCSLYNATECKHCHESFHSPIKSNPRVYCGDECRREAEEQRREILERAIVEAHGENPTLASISRSTGVSEVTVAKVLARLGLRKQVKGDAAFHRVLGEISRDELLREISSPGGLTSLMICYTIGESTVRRLLAHHGLSDILP